MLSPSPYFPTRSSLTLAPHRLVFEVLALRLALAAWLCWTSYQLGITLESILCSGNVGRLSCAAELWFRHEGIFGVFTWTASTYGNLFSNFIDRIALRTFLSHILPYIAVAVAVITAKAG